ncbi:MAG: hypothetical protein PWP31_227 [Clostridia bacterium]|nr:hypothetical protein [Clostridia bacterium]
MYKVHNRRLSLLLVFLFVMTVILPAGTAFGTTSKVDIYGSLYKCVSAGDGVEGSTVSVVYKNDFTDVSGFDGSGLDKLVIQVSLPDGVEFANTPSADDVGNLDSDKLIMYSSNLSEPNLITADSNYCEIETNAGEWTDNSKFEFDFSKNGGLDIADDFSGDVDVTIEVICFTDSGKIVWTEDEDVTIARVSGITTSITAGDPEKITWGAGRELAKITLQEGQAGEFTDNEKIYFKILTDDVTFSNGIDISQVDTTRISVKQDVYFGNNDQIVYLEIKDPSSGFPGKIEFTPKVDICPIVSGDIKIKVYSSKEDTKVEETELVIGKVVDEAGTIEEIKDNDTVVYAGSDKKLDASFKYWPDGDIITLTLNKGKFDKNDLPEFDGNQSNVQIYNNDRSVYYEISSGYGGPVKIKNIHVTCDNDVETGDIILTVGGQDRDGQEIVIGKFAKPFTVTAEKPEIQGGAFEQAAGKLIISEADAETINEAVYMELPSGIEFNGTPSVKVTQGDIDVSVNVKDKNILVLNVNEKSSSASTIEISNIKYDVESLVLPGDVKLDIYTESDDSLLFEVANATVVDDSIVKASFALGDEGVYVINGRTLVQVNLLCDVLGLQKMWDATNKMACFMKNGRIVAFPIGEDKIIINGCEISVDQGARIINDYTCATLRGLKMAFGGDLDWDNDNKIASFTFGK